MQVWRDGCDPHALHRCVRSVAGGIPGFHPGGAGSTPAGRSKLRHPRGLTERHRSSKPNDGGSTPSGGARFPRSSKEECLATNQVMGVRVPPWGPTRRLWDRRVSHKDDGSGSTPLGGTACGDSSGGRAPVLQTGVRWFDPNSPYHGHVAQRKRQPAQTRPSVGSNPSVATTKGGCSGGGRHGRGYAALLRSLAGWRFGAGVRLLRPPPRKVKWQRCHTGLENRRRSAQGFDSSAFRHFEESLSSKGEDRWLSTSR